MARLDPQQRMRMAQDLRRLSNQPGLPVKRRQEARRHAFNLVQINAFEAKREPKPPKALVPPKPPAAPKL